jgi:type II secretory pathway component GspD/PulD (secretin)
MRRRHFGGVRRADISGLCVLLALLLLGNLAELDRAVGQESSGEAPYKIFALKSISAEQARLYLGEARIGTVSVLPGANAVLVTAGADDLAKAQAVLNLVDVNEPFVVKAVLSGEELRGIPSNQQLAEKIGGISIGSFSSPPDAKAKTRAIVGVHKGALLVLAPTNRFGQIVTAVEELRKEMAQAKPADQLPERPDIKSIVEKIEIVEPNDVNEPNAVTTRPTAPKPTQKPIDEPEPSSIYRPASVADGSKELTLNLPGTIGIIDLIDLAAQYLQLDFMYDPKVVTGEVTLKLSGKLRGPIKVKELYPLLEVVLKYKNFAMTRHGNLVVIVPLNEVLNYDPVLVEADRGRVLTGDVLVTRPFKLKYIDTASAQNLLQGLQLGATPIAPIEDARMIIVTDYAYRMPRIERVLELIDKPGEPKKFRFRQLKYTMAQNLVQKVKALAEQLQNLPITVGALQTAAAGQMIPSIPGRPTPVAPVPRPPVPTGRTQPTETAGQPTVYLDADERTNRILMIGLDRQLDTVEELIEALDVQQQDLRELKAYRIVHVDAEDARNKLTELGVISAAVATTTGRTGRFTSTDRITGQRTPGVTPVTTQPTPTASPFTSTMAREANEPLAGEPQVVVIEATNSLLVNATAEQHLQIDKILKFVDSTTEEQAIPYVIYPLESQKPEELASVIEKLIQETVKDKEGKIERVVKKTDEEIVIVPDEKSFSIIVYASKKNQEWIKKLIETLDKPRPQVLIDVTLVEISKTDKFEYDLNFIESFPDLVQTSGLTGSLGGGATAKVIVDQLRSTSLDRYVDIQSNKGNFTGFYADTHVNALLTAMQEKKYGRVLAKPKILVNDNEKGTISTTDTTYVTKKSSAPIGVIQSGQGGVTPPSYETSVQFEGYPAGIQLEITPHISEGNLLRLEISMTRSDFTSNPGDKPPDTTESKVGTVVTVPDRSTIILGGMIKLNQLKGGTKVPVLGDVPLLGVLFRSVSNEDIQKRLYVFVKAEVIRPAVENAAGLPDLEETSRKNRVAFEKFEQRFQRYQSVPGIRPGPMDPVKVLETE